MTQVVKEGDQVERHLVFTFTDGSLYDEVPSFVQCEGPLQLMGSIVRIEFVSPRLSMNPEDKKISSQ